MANMQCKTKGNANPKGKPRVYFTCHSDDFEVLLQTTADAALPVYNIDRLLFEFRCNQELYGVSKRARLYTKS